MNKMNKKGFTLIEMLVVIAIIAVLVSIIIPTVSSATGKAKAATDAANLRSMLAEATTDYLNGQSEGDTNFGLVKLTVAESGGVKSYTFDCTAGPESKSVTGENGAKVYATIEVDANGTLTARYGEYLLSDFQLVAENGGTLTGTYEAPDDEPADPVNP